MPVSLKKKMPVSDSTIFKISTVLCILVQMKSFPRFWRNHSLCRNKWYLIHIMKAKLIFTEGKMFMKIPKSNNKKQKKCQFSSSANSQYFSWTLQGWVIGWVWSIDEKGIDVVQPIWLSACLCKLKNGVKMHFLCVLPIFWAWYVNHTGWATLLPFVQIYFTTLRCQLNE